MHSKEGVLPSPRGPLLPVNCVSCLQGVSAHGHPHGGHRRSLPSLEMTGYTMRQELAHLKGQLSACENVCLNQRLGNNLETNQPLV